MGQQKVFLEGPVVKVNKMNYQKELDKTIEQLKNDTSVPKLLLHSCCAPCSSYVLEYLSEYFDITVLYYNPNISPAEEYTYRINELNRLINEMHFKNEVRCIPTDYEPQKFYDAVKGYENEPEGGDRCTICYRLRLEEAAKYASELGADYFTTTLSISPMKDAERLNSIGLELEKEYNVKYLLSDFKKKNGYKRSIELSKEHNLYRQNYCGCIYSKKMSEKED